MKRFLIGLSISLLCLVGFTLSQAIGEEKVIVEGSKVEFDYVLTVEGAKVDTSEGNRPMEYVQGEGTIIKGLERQMIGLKTGDEKVIKVAPEEGYGKVNPEAFQEVQKSQLPQGISIEVGTILRSYN
ncbi:MAG: FKBP-type peptidyl-prolyl cis-trans isomerase [Verrucomicrobiales bacterium]